MPKPIERAFAPVAPDGAQDKASFQDAATTREERLARMTRFAQDGKAAQKTACAQGARMRVTSAGLDACEAGWPPYDGRRPPRPQRVRCAKARPAQDRTEFDDPRAYNNDRAPSARRSGRRHRRMGRLARKLVSIAVLLLLVIAAILFFWPRVQQALTPSFRVTLPDNLEGLLPDETMGYTAIDFSDAILGESREQKELVVMEQDVKVTSLISQELLNISLFSKQKLIHSYGTGVYTVDLKGLTASDVAMDEASRIITVTVPHARLAYVNVDVEKTEFEDTKKALFAVGDIKLTAEQEHAIDRSVDAALREELRHDALFTKADEIALNKIRELFQTPVSALSDDYIVKIVMA